MIDVTPIIVTSVVVVTLLYMMFVYNNYVQLRNLVDKSQANIDVLLKQRADEIPKLVDIVKGYTKHESDMLLALTKLRSGMKAKGSQHDKTTRTVNMLIAEAYSDLKANKNFLKLQTRMTGLETKLAQRRTFYNDTVTNFNNYVQKFPHNMFRIPPRELF